MELSFGKNFLMVQEGLYGCVMCQTRTSGALRCWSQVCSSCRLHLTVHWKTGEDTLKSIPTKVGHCPEVLWYARGFRVPEHHQRFSLAQCRLVPFTWQPANPQTGVQSREARFFTPENTSLQLTAHLTPQHLRCTWWSQAWTNCELLVGVTSSWALNEASCSKTNVLQCSPVFCSLENELIVYILKH